jgi:hypothetical protein
MKFSLFIYAIHALPWEVVNTAGGASKSYKVNLVSDDTAGTVLSLLQVVDSREESMCTVNFKTPGHLDKLSSCVGQSPKDANTCKSCEDSVVRRIYEENPPYKFNIAALDQETETWNLKPQQVIDAIQECGAKMPEVSASSMTPVKCERTFPVAKFPAGAKEGGGGGPHCDEIQSQCTLSVSGQVLNKDFHKALGTEIAKMINNLSTGEVKAAYRSQMAGACIGCGPFIGAVPVCKKVGETEEWKVPTSITIIGAMNNTAATAVVGSTALLEAAAQKLEYTLSCQPSTPKDFCAGPLKDSLPVIGLIPAIGSYIAASVDLVCNILPNASLGASLTAEDSSKFIATPATTVNLIQDMWDHPSPELQELIDKASPEEIEKAKAYFE